MSISQKDNGDSPLFFYAAQDAAFYDDAAPLTDRSYDIIHEVLTQVLAVWMSTQSSVSGTRLIVDVGCGTGAEALRVLEVIQDCHVLCIDSSAEMLSIFREKAVRAYGEALASSKLTLVQADVRQEGWLRKSLHG